MNRISAYNLEATQVSLRGAFENGTLPDGLYEPLQSFLATITEGVAKDPVAVYLFSSDEDAELRDLFAYALAKTLREHIPSALLVDCAFADVGMHGIVPEKDSLGFLDFLLYGSSIGVITQETAAGVCVVGAGSFPVTKRMPFVMSAFEDAARRLVTHARCAIFTGPLHDDEGGLHPLIGAVSLPIFLRAVGTRAQGSVVPSEEEISARWNTSLLTIRMQAPGATPRPAPASVPDRDEYAPPESIPEAPASSAEPTNLEDTAQITYDEKTYTSLVPRIITIVLGLLVVAFVVWWFVQGRTPVGPPSQARAPSTQTTSGDMAPLEDKGAPEPTADTVAVATPADATTQPQEPPPSTRGTPTSSSVGMPPPVDHTDTGGRTGGTVLIGSEDIHVLADLEQNWAGWWVIHISSFRESIKAREEVAYLESREFPVFIVFLDLGAKGKWYRVYAGPFRSREAAAVVKKNLDDIPRVRFTRMGLIGE